MHLYSGRTEIEWFHPALDPLCSYRSQGVARSRQGQSSFVSGAARSGIGAWCMTDPLDPDGCDREVYLRGSVIHIEALCKADAEMMLARLREQDPKARIDWHYVAGRAVFKRLAPKQSLFQRVVRRLRR